MNFWKWLLIASGLFIAGLILGMSITTGLSGIFEAEAAALGEFASAITPLPQFVIFIFILLKNLSVVVFSFIMSPLLCIVPVITLVFNGGLIGLISVVIIEEESLPFLLAGLLPHGILEIPALLIGEAVALSFGVSILQGIFSRSKRNVIMPNFRKNLKFLVISAVLFFAAALIETLVTPRLLDLAA